MYNNPRREGKTDMILKGYLFSLLYGIACLALAMFVYKLGVPKKYTRKIVHILVGFEWVILYRYFGATYHFLLVCLFFLALLLISHFGKLLPMISSDDDNSLGTVYYAVAMTGVAIVGLFEPGVMLPFGIGVICTSVGDGFAGVVGQLVKKHNPKIYKNKTVFGFTTNLLASFLASYLLSYIFEIGLSLWQCHSLVVLSCGIELIVGFGMDNIAITWSVTALGYLFLNVNGVENYLVPILATPFVIAFVIEKKALTKWGTAAAIFMDAIISIAFGNFGFVTLISFFVGSVIVDKIKAFAKHSLSDDETLKRGTRDVIQVIANGAVPTAAACAFVFSKGNPIFAIAFVASLAEAFADTAASGIGAFSKAAFDPFRWRKCSGGLSGGMSLLGTFASLIGATAISFLAMALTKGAFSIEYVAVASIVAFFGALFDSLLGSLCQVKFRCEVCGKLTEKKVHCALPTKKAEGIRFVDNDVVNVASGFFAAAASVVLFYCFGII